MKLLMCVFHFVGFFSLGRSRCFHISRSIPVVSSVSFLIKISICAAMQDTQQINMPVKDRGP